MLRTEGWKIFRKITDFFDTVVGFIVLEILIEILFFALIVSCFNLVKTYLPTNIYETAGALLTITSIVFGFLTLTFSQPYQELRQTQNSVSNLVKELLDLLNEIKKDEGLAKKYISWNTKVDKWGFRGFGFTAGAEEAVRFAINYLLTSMREVISGSQHSILVWVVPALIFFLTSMSMSFLSFFNFGNITTMLSTSLMTLISGTSFLLIGGFEINRRITQINDSIFNIRQLILMGINDLDTYRRFF